MRDFITSSTANPSDLLGFAHPQTDDVQDGKPEQAQFQLMREELYFNLKKKIMKVGK